MPKSALSRAANATGNFVGDLAAVKAVGAVGSGFYHAGGHIVSGVGHVVGGVASGVGSVVGGVAGGVGHVAGGVGSAVGKAAGAVGGGLWSGVSGLGKAVAAGGRVGGNVFSWGGGDWADLQKLAKLYGIQEDGKILNLPPAEMPPEIFVKNFSEEAWQSLHELIRASVVEKPTKEKLLEWCAQFFYNKLQTRATVSDVGAQMAKIRGEESKDGFRKATDAALEGLDEGPDRRLGDKISQFL